MQRVWDPLVRLVHWGVALAVAVNFFNEGGSALHRYAGYLAAELVAARIVRGVAGHGYAAFSGWELRPASVLSYLRKLARGQAPRTMALNPAGAVMAITLWTLLGLMAVSGWMMGLDAYWGEEWLMQVHAFIAYALLACVVVHVGAVVTMSVKHRENLVKAMLTGKKRAE